MVQCKETMIAFYMIQCKEMYDYLYIIIYEYIIMVYCKKFVIINYKFV